jgi:hypothetical protein
MSKRQFPVPRRLQSALAAQSGKASSASEAEPAAGPRPSDGLIGCYAQRMSTLARSAPETPAVETVVRVREIGRGAPEPPVSDATALEAPVRADNRPPRTWRRRRRKGADTLRDHLIAAALSLAILALTGALRALA